MKYLDAYFRENYNKLVKMARYRVDGYSLASAEDAVQEAFYRACRYHRTFREGEDLNNWFRGILHNTINTIKEGERNRGVVYRDDLETRVVEIQDKLEVPTHVSELLHSASSRDQEILNMRFFFGFKTREIHELLNVSHDVVRDVIRRFKTKLR